jgi:hypothetical protein
MPHYDLVVMVDVFEHLDKEAGKELINDVMQRADHFIISVPATWSAQGAAYGNEYEVHKSQWSYEEFEVLGFKRISQLDSPITVIKSKNLN